MSKRILWALALLCVLAAAPAVAAQQHEQWVYTYVAEWQVPRAQWADYTAGVEKNTKPIVQRRLADGTLISWGTYETVVHTLDGPTHGLWLQSHTLAGLTRTREELLKNPPSPALSASKHWDYLLRSVAHRAGPSAERTGYLRVVGTLTKPGKGDQWADAIKKYLQPAFDELLANGTLLYYAIDSQYVPTENPGLRYVVFIYPNAEAMDKFAEAIAARVAQAEFTAAMSETSAPEQRRDYMAQVTHYAHK